MKTLLPPGWPRPHGYANGMSARVDFIVTAGVVGWNDRRRVRDETSPVSSDKS